VLETLALPTTWSYEQVSNTVLQFSLLLQERTSRYIARLARELIELLWAGTGAMADLVDFNLLKFKERDALEDVLRSWTSAAAGAEYDVAALRDTRLRHFFGNLHSSVMHVSSYHHAVGVFKHSANLL
jgi:Domain of unknown function (DUF4471)